MNITNIKNEIKDFMNKLDVDVVEMSYIPGLVHICVDSVTGEQYEERDNDMMNITIKNDPELTEQQNQDLFDFENYLYTCKNGLVLNYEVTDETTNDEK